MKKELQPYFKNLPKDRLNRLKELHSLILELFPSATTSMKYKMPTYEWQDGWVALANQKNYISLYTCGPQHLASFKKKYPDLKTGKGCINFRDKDEIPYSALKDVITSAITSPKGSYKNNLA
jgi:uncharacterized protein YdhG (YjbR/CyaY superfamily)